MSIKLITNIVWQNAANFIAHNASNFTEIVDTGTLNLVGGPRHLGYSSSDTALRRISYLNSAATLAADTLILCGASSHSAKAVNLLSWTNSSTSASIAAFPSFAEVLSGPTLQDWVYEFSALASKYAFTVEFATTAYTKTAIKLVYGSSLTLSNPDKPTYYPLWETEILGRNAYQVEYGAEWIFTKVTKAQAQTLERIYRPLTDPVFLYDSTGYHIPDKLWHGIITELNISPSYNDVHTVKIKSSRLRHY